MKKGYLITIIILIFIISLAVRYYPILSKGFSHDLEVENLILARNLSLTGEYKIDDEKNVVLSSEIVKEKGIVSRIGNKLTAVLYSKAFDWLGLNQDIPIYISLFLYGIISILFFLLIFKLFNIWVALLFSFVEIFSPLVSQYVTRSGLYEWGILFLSIGLFIYLWKEKPNLFRLFLTGLFFALASLARNSLLILIVPFLVYEFWQTKSFKRVIIFILPVLIFWGIYLGPAFLEGGVVDNAYLSSQETTSAYLHIFPDSYTWHFERDAYVENLGEITNYDYSQFLSTYGYPVSLKNKILMYWASLTSYPKGLFAQTNFGGPILVFFLILGAFYLYKTKKYLLKLFILWAVLLYLFLVIRASNHWGHFLSLQLPLFLLISLGIYWFIQLILKQNFKKYFKYLLILGFILALFLHLIQSDKWMFHEGYLYSKIDKTLELVEPIKKDKDRIKKTEDVIAVGVPNNRAPLIINWYTDFSAVYFDPVTIEKLLKENKLQWAFDQFSVTKIIGYDKDLTEKIIEATNVEVIKPELAL